MHCLVLTHLSLLSLRTPWQICLHKCPRGLVTVCPIFRYRAARVAKKNSVLLAFKAILWDFPPKKSYEEKEENIQSKQIKFWNEQVAYGDPLCKSWKNREKKQKQENEEREVNKFPALWEERPDKRWVVSDIAEIPSNHQTATISLIADKTS